MTKIIILFNFTIRITELHFFENGALREQILFYIFDSLCIKNHIFFACTMIWDTLYFCGLRKCKLYLLFNDKEKYEKHADHQRSDYRADHPHHSWLLTTGFHRNFRISVHRSVRVRSSRGFTRWYFPHIEWQVLREGRRCVQVLWHNIFP